MTDPTPAPVTEPGYEVDGTVYVFIEGDSGPFGGRPFLATEDLDEER